MLCATIVCGRNGADIRSEWDVFDPGMLHLCDNGNQPLSSFVSTFRVGVQKSRWAVLDVDAAQVEHRWTEHDGLSIECSRHRTQLVMVLVSAAACDCSTGFHGPPDRLSEAVETKSHTSGNTHAYLPNWCGPALASLTE